jgi:hypothetical protein
MFTHELCDIILIESNYYCLYIQGERTKFINQISLLMKYFIALITCHEMVPVCAYNDISLLLK